MSYTRALDLIESLKEEIDFEFHNRVQIVVDEAETLYSTSPYKIKLASHVIHDPELMYFLLMMARKELRIFSRLGRGNLWIGFTIYYVSTSLLWLPIFFSYFWYKYNREVAREIVRATVLLYGKIQTKYLARKTKENCSNFFMDRKYWLWPEDIDSWLVRTHYEILLEEGLV